ncbi:sulfotransferase [Sphingobium sp. AEW4]|nr:sulfotransferase [Sphingobium sp. AEW4]
MKESIAGSLGDVPAWAAGLPDAARARIGYADLGTGWEEGFVRLTQAIDRLDLPNDRIAVSAGRLQAMLEARLHARKGWNAHPESLSRKIEKPIVIAGLVRSGTTALHKLMSMDPQFQGPENWLSMAPKPRPPRDQWSQDADYRETKARVDAVIARAPELFKDHMMSADEVDESIYFLAQNFHYNYFSSIWGVPEYDAWQRQQSERPNYEWMRDCLKLIGLHDDRTWLLKNPGDLYGMGALLEVFPDARVIQTHRDPVDAIPSITRLLVSSQRGTLGYSDPAAVGARETNFWRDALAEAERAKQSAPDQFIDIEFRAFVADRMGTVRRIYDHFGITLSSEAEAAMQDWLDAHPHDGGGGSRRADGEPPREKLAEAFADYRVGRGY